VNVTRRESKLACSIEVYVTRRESKLACFIEVYVTRRESKLACSIKVYVTRRESKLACSIEVNVTRRESKLACSIEVYVTRRESKLACFIEVYVTRRESKLACSIEVYVTRRESKLTCSSLLLLVRSVFSPHSSLSPSIWTGIFIITCQIRVLPAFIPLALNMDRDTLPLNMDRDAYYYLSDPCSPRIHPSPPQYGQGYSPPQYEQGYSLSQYGQGYLLLLVRYVFSPHSSLSPSIWTGILIITWQIRVLPAFIPLPLNMDRDTYYYLSDPCSPRIHPSPPQYGQRYLLLLFRSVFSPHSSFSPSILTGIIIITC
jgi:hypothetical protein